MCSREMLADSISRWENDPGDYTLNPHIFRNIIDHFCAHQNPTIDMFVSPGKPRFAKYRQYNVRKIMLPKAAPQGNSSECPSVNTSRFAGGVCHSTLVNSSPVADQTKGQPKSQVSAPGALLGLWRLLTQLLVPKSHVLLVNPRLGLFQNCMGDFMPGLKWPLDCMIVSGGSYRTNKLRHKVSTIV